MTLLWFNHNLLIRRFSFVSFKQEKITEAKKAKKEENGGTSDDEEEVDGEDDEEVDGEDEEYDLPYGEDDLDGEGMYHYH